MVPYFCKPSTKLSCKISKNHLGMFIWMKKSIEFQMPYIKFYDCHKPAAHPSPNLSLSSWINQQKYSKLQICAPGFMFWTDSTATLTS